MRKKPDSDTGPKLKPTPMPAEEAAITDVDREAQKAYLLLQLLNAEGQTLTRGEANKFRDLTKRARGMLNISKAAMANYRRERLAESKYLMITPGRTIHYTLLPDGRDYLAACVRHLDGVEFRLKGKTLNTLIALAHETGFHVNSATTESKRETVAPDSAQLAISVLAAFEDLRRERHSRSGLVPIHEVRQWIADRHGLDAARHDILDEVILDLWRDKRIGLEGISNLGSATEQQLNDSIPGVGNTIFYLEVPSDQPALA